MKISFSRESACKRSTAEFNLNHWYNFLVPFVLLRRSLVKKKHCFMFVTVDCCIFLNTTVMSASLASQAPGGHIPKSGNCSRRLCSLTQSFESFRCEQKLSWFQFLLPRRGFLCRDAQDFWCSCVRPFPSVRPSRHALAIKLKFKTNLMARSRKNREFWGMSPKAQNYEATVTRL